jgi:FkbM family methyltransferase
MTFYALCGGVALSGFQNVTCLQKGLGSSSQIGNQTLKIISNDGGGSSLHAETGIICEEVIEIQTLDSYNFSNIGFIKMDVEENELYVLEGGKETIKRCGYPKILFESNSDNPELFNYLINEFNYNIININGYSNMFLATK